MPKNELHELDQDPRSKRPRDRVAVDYVRAGCPVLALHNVRASRCTCRDPDCAVPGRHPRAGAIATTDPIVVKQQFQRWRRARIGIVTGGQGNLVAIETTGKGSWQQLKAMLPHDAKLPPTVVIRDGRKTIRLFRNDEGPHCRGRLIAAGVRILADGDIIVAPDEASIRRRFADGRAIGEIEIPPLPDAVKSLGLPHSTQPSAAATMPEQIELLQPIHAPKSVVRTSDQVTVGIEPAAQPKRRGRPRKVTAADSGSSNTATSAAGVEDMLIAPAAIADADAIARDKLVFDALRALYQSASPHVQAKVKEMVRA